MKSNQVAYFVSCFIVACLFTGCAAKQGNLLLNPDMEAGKTLPDKWDTWSHVRETSTFTLEEGKAQSGKKYVLIHSPEDNDARFNQTISVQKGAYYKVTGWIRTKDVPTAGRGANISLAGMHLGSQGFYGTSDSWQKEEFYLKIEGDLNSITLSLALGGYGGMSRGYAYFDNIQVQRVIVPPPDAQVNKLGENKPVQAKPTSVTEGLKPFLNLFRGYQGGDFVMLGAMAFSIVLALVILFLKKEANQQNQPASQAVAVENPVQPIQPDLESRPEAQPESSVETSDPENPPDPTDDNTSL